MEFEDRSSISALSNCLVTDDTKLAKFFRDAKDKTCDDAIEFYNDFEKSFPGFLYAASLASREIQVITGFPTDKLIHANGRVRAQNAQGTSEWYTAASFPRAAN